MNCLSTVKKRKATKYDILVFKLEFFIDLCLGLNMLNLSTRSLFLFRNKKVYFHSQNYLINASCYKKACSACFNEFSLNS